MKAGIPRSGRDGLRRILALLPQNLDSAVRWRGGRGSCGGCSGRTGLRVSAAVGFSGGSAVGFGLRGRVPDFYWPTCRPRESSDLSEQSEIATLARSGTGNRGTRENGGFRVTRRVPLLAGKTASGKLRDVGAVRDGRECDCGRRDASGTSCCETQQPRGKRVTWGSGRLPRGRGPQR